jgi:Flp pilus assembly protein TadD
MQKGDCGAAVSEFRAVTGQDAEHVGALFNMGNCLNRLGSREEAKEALRSFDEVTRRDAERVDAQRRTHFLLLDAVERFERNDLDGALSALDGAAVLAPEQPSVHAIRAQILDESGRHEEALASYKQAASLDPTDPVLLVEVGRLLGRAGRFEEALGFFRRAADSAPRMPEVRFFLAAAYRSLGRHEEAEAEEAILRKLRESP